MIMIKQYHSDHCARAVNSADHELKNMEYLQLILIRHIKSNCNTINPLDHPENKTTSPVQFSRFTPYFNSIMRSPQN